MSVRWYPEDLWQHTAPVLPGFTVEVLPRIDSTNTELMRRARAGQTEPILLIAEDQTAGKGRQGRPWSNAPGSVGVSAEGWEGTARICYVEPMGVRTCVGAHGRVRVGARARDKQRILAR